MSVRISLDFSPWALMTKFFSTWIHSNFGDSSSPWFWVPFLGRDTLLTPGVHLICFYIALDNGNAHWCPCTNRCKSKHWNLTVIRPHPQHAYVIFVWSIIKIKSSELKNTTRGPVDLVCVRVCVCVCVCEWLIERYTHKSISKDIYFTLYGSFFFSSFIEI